MIGEISIRHKLSGENAFFIFAAFDAGFLTEYIKGLFHKQKAKACIGGWVEQSADDYEAFLYWTEQSDRQQSQGENHDRTNAAMLTAQALDHTAAEVRKIYKSIG